MNSDNVECEINIPDYMPITGHDAYNYAVQYGTTNFHVQFVLKIDGYLKPNKLLKAIRLIVDAEPVLGCRLICDEQSAYWQRIEDMDKEMFCFIEETANPYEVIQSFLKAPLDMHNHPQTRLKLVRSGKHDYLCVKINHIVADAGGGKEYLQQLADIYTYIDSGKNYVPKPRMRNRKDQDRLFESLRIQNPEDAWNPGLEALLPTWAFPWESSESEDSQNTAICRLYLEPLMRYAKTMNVKVNDLVLTAFYRAMFEVVHPQFYDPMEILVTVDLRRYLPDKRTQAIRNFSGSVNARLARLPDEVFAETLSRVSAMMSEIKNNNPGLQSAIGLERLEKMSFGEVISYMKNGREYDLSTGKCSPVLSNIGFIGTSLLRFGESVVEDAFLVTPAISAPGFLFGVSTYKGILTLVTSYYDTPVRREAVDKLFKMIEKELLDISRLY